MRIRRLAGSSVVILSLAAGSAAVFKQAKISGIEVPTSKAEVEAKAEELERLRAECLSFVANSEYSKAQSCFQRGYDLAQARADTEYSARFLTYIASVDLYTYRLRSAMKGYLAARAAAKADGNQALVSAISSNISWVYSALGAFEEASAAIEEAAQSVPASARDQYLPKIRMQQANLAVRGGDYEAAMGALREGLHRADRTGDTEMMCSILDGVGRELLRRGEPDLAEPFVVEAYRLYALVAPPVPDVSYLNLAILHYQQDKLDAASRFIELALEASNKPARSLPAWTLYFHRSRIRRASGDYASALADLEKAVAHARALRLDLLPAASVRVGAGIGLRAIYEEYVDVSRLLYEQNADRRHILRSFEVAEQSRAAGLRETLNAAEDLREKLPLEYWELLRTLTETEQDHVRGNEIRAGLGKIRHRLTEMEIEAGMSAENENLRGNPAPASARRLQSVLENDRALLAFHLGDQMSHLWAVTSSGIEMHLLPPRNWIEKAVSEFRHAVEESAPEAWLLGEALHRMLFGGLSASVRGRNRWDILADGVLFSLPFAALVVADPALAGSPRPAAEGAPGSSFLVERHSLRMLPGAGSLFAAEAKRWNGPLTIVSDPIYNAADPRFGAPDMEPADGFQLSRLAGTRREAQQCVLAFDGGQPSVLLHGASASTTAVEDSLSREPAILHFATHVVPAPDDSQNGFIALSLGTDGRMEMLGSTAVSALHAHPSLVIMSGCSSGAGTVLPGEGLFGLTRAWLRAGAHNVAATLWPTPDQSGELLQALYRNLSPADGEERIRPPHEALQMAQVEMIRSGGWRSQSEYWASYFLVGRN